MRFSHADFAPRLRNNSSDAPGPRESAMAPEGFEWAFSGYDSAAEPARVIRILIVMHSNCSYN